MPHAIDLRIGEHRYTFQPDPQGPARVQALSTGGSMGTIRIGAAPDPFHQPDAHRAGVSAPLSVPVYAPDDVAHTVVCMLPDPVDGTALLVSLIVLAHPSVRRRSDVFAPATGPTHGAIRERGQVVAVTALVAAPEADLHRHSWPTKNGVVSGPCWECGASMSEKFGDEYTEEGK